MQQTVMCDSCQGIGEVYSDKDKCRKCKGKRTVSERKVLELYIPRGSHNGEKIVLAGEADQSPDQEPGDIVFVLEEKEHDVFHRAGSDLSTHIEITLVEALCGFSRVVLKHLDGRGILLNHQKPKGGVLKPKQLLKVEGEGMPVKKSETNGDLYLIVEVIFPEDDWLQDESLTSKLNEMLPQEPPKIEAEAVDEVEYDQDAEIEQIGSGGGQGGEWEDEDEEEDGVHGAQCRQQ